MAIVIDVKVITKGGMMDSIKKDVNDVENKMHELKGRVKQKMKDAKKS